MIRNLNVYSDLEIFSDFSDDYFYVLYVFKLNHYNICIIVFFAYYASSSKCKVADKLRE